ncbi:RNA recognition motif domain-containing protein [Chitinophaga rhizosphaerae]|jgi:RNA recognition motif-containing protein|uniref:RNA recognition motif domain-containing protein n=1 Tax=Chitinophaga rhizosphaerae TaxID=1864947 RepID=UPI000F809CE3|nr:RNA-binding protein [Chitinophaga rhizosphaerae]
MNLYVSNLMSHLRDEDLFNIFSPFGRVESCKVIVDRYTGVSRGFGFVEMPERQEALDAIRELEGKEIEGRQIAISEAKPRVDRDRGDRRY